MGRPVVLVTGSSRGIGAAIAEVLRARGAQVICHASRDYDDGTVTADLSEPLGPQIVWEDALALGGGRVDVLVNNAGISGANPIAASDIDWLDKWEDTMRINLTAAAALSRYAVKHWLETGREGRLVHIASRAAHRGDSPDHWHYAASKGGLLAMHKTIARAYAAQGILSFAIAPGFTDTVLAEGYTAELGPGLTRDIPLGRMAEPEEIGAIVAFCALDAPESMTGAVIDANGASYVR